MQPDHREQFVQQFPILEFLDDSAEPPLDRLAIEELELVLGIFLPQDYIQFLLAFNGGSFSPWVQFDVPHPTKFVSGGILSGMYGEPGDGTQGIGACSKMLRDRLPEEYLAIADCNGQDLLVLRFDGPRNFAGVWFWDCAPLDNDPRLYWVADTFHDFLRLLSINPDEFNPGMEISPIFRAIERNDRHATSAYLLEAGPIESRNDRGWTLLICAAHYGYPRVVKLLLEHGADPHARDHERKTPLHHAAQSSLDCVKLLLAAGADIEARDKEGHGVIGNWYYRADKYLREHGAEE